MSLSREMILSGARWSIDAMRVSVALLRLDLVLRGYDPDQPRVPAGSSEGGRWTDGDGGNPNPAQNDGRIIRISDEGSRRYAIVLADEETRGGHTLRKHVGKTDEEMLERVRASRREFPIVTYGLRRNGSFDSAESANDFVNRSLEQNAAKVDLVASGREDAAFITSRFGYKTGREAYTGGRLDPYMRTTYGVGIFIVRDPKNRNGYRVHSAYPRNDGD